MAIVVEISEHNTETSARVFANEARGTRHVSKRSIPIVVIKNSLLTFEIVRRARDGNILQHARARSPRSWRKVTTIKFSEIRNVNIQIAIIIVVTKCRSHAPLWKGPAGIGNPSRLRDFRKRAVTIIAIQ